MLIVTGDGPDPWRRIPYGETLRKRLERHGADDTPLLITELPNPAGTRVALARPKPDSGGFELLTLARQLSAPLLERRPASIALLLVDLAPAFAARAADALLAALLAASFALPSYKSKRSAARPLKRIALYGLSERLDLRRTQAEAAGNNLARRLTSLPPNHLTPGLYRREVAKLARAHGWTMRFLGIKQLQKLKAGAFLAVAQSSPAPDAGILQLRYRPKGRKGKALALVGKGICYDTGGLNLKPAKHMHGMHEDMAGSAVALGTLLALSELKAPFAIDCWLALARNDIGPQAYKQNEVVSACDGTTIEVMHTDAEGRMVLADTLALASRERPDLLIDYATLTGACVYSLSSRYSGAFTNREALIEPIIAAGRSSGERVWPFPMDSDFDKDLESGVADIKQCTLGGEADHILAARFLSRFVGDTPWLHLDLAANNRKGGLAHIPTDVTGFGIRYSLDLLLDKQVL